MSNLNIELYTRKKTVSFLEKLLRCINDDFRHDLFKSILYDEIPYKTSSEEKFKNYYDSFMYLLNNKSSPFTTTLLEKFFYLYDKDLIIDDYILDKLTTYYFNISYLDGIKQAILFHIEVYKQLSFIDENTKLILSLIFLNYILVRNNIPIIRILRLNFDKYLKYRNLFIKDNSKDLEDFIRNLVENEKIQTKEFTYSLKKVTTLKIINQFKKDKELLINNYKIKDVYLFGSFAKNIERIDSDIDIEVKFDEDLSYEKRLKYIEELTLKYQRIFKRYFDITEISHLTSNEQIIEDTIKIKLL